MQPSGAFLLAALEVLKRALSDDQGSLLLVQVDHSGGIARALSSSTLAPSVVDVPLDQRLVKAELVVLYRLLDQSLELTDALLADLGAAGYAHALDRLAGGLLDHLEQPALALGDEQDRLPLAPGAPRTPNPVNVALGVGGDVLVNHLADPLDVEPSGCHIGADDDVDLTLFEPVHGALARILAHLARQRRRLEALRHKFIRKIHGGGAGTHKDEHRLKVFSLEDARQRLELVVSGHRHVALADRLDRGGLGGDGDVLGLENRSAMR